MNKINLKNLTLNDFPLKTFDKIRYRDTDRQGHVNNAVFTTFLETGRAEFFYNPKRPMSSPGGSFVIANITLDLLAEINWPGAVDIGTAILNVGKSSIHLVQGIFYNGEIAGTAETVIVHINDETRRPQPLSEETRSILHNFLLQK
ncbi:acyl-CoA thioesterase [Serpentinicella alkaliphila]|uniref:Acyl-CoA thioester hydrolase n=1 Tax=Serpentinicella alkaliphila TaxID=1734049 RepID=A0A4R2TTE1_9FIRM|nr:thioesterase family protein [Serpentinicella alkaliphila]QUH25232.1 acyl-CoA thioesterase [Serpentinicella alkaliphila]TCQ07041.1 acyl-CoA thioester hydrolase [Serpentinicella alkaliphila]